MEDGERERERERGLSRLSLFSLFKQRRRRQKTCKRRWRRPRLSAQRARRRSPLCSLHCSTVLSASLSISCRAQSSLLGSCPAALQRREEKRERHRASCLSVWALPLIYSPQGERGARGTHGVGGGREREGDQDLSATARGEEKGIPVRYSSRFFATSFFFGFVSRFLSTLDFARFSVSISFHPQPSLALPLDYLSALISSDLVPSPQIIEEQNREILTLRRRDVEALLESALTDQDNYVKEIKCDRSLDLCPLCFCLRSLALSHTHSHTHHTRTTPLTHLHTSCLCNFLHDLLSLPPSLGSHPRWPAGNSRRSWKRRRRRPRAHSRPMRACSKSSRRPATAILPATAGPRSRE